MSIKLVQPKQTMSKPIADRSSNSPPHSRYLTAAGQPGACEVLTHYGGVNPLARALRARSPAVINRRGSVVLVQLVIDAMANEKAGDSGSVSAITSASVLIPCKSCGRRGPAADGKTVARSNSKVWLKVGFACGSNHKSASL